MCKMAVSVSKTSNYEFQQMLFDNGYTWQDGAAETRYPWAKTIYVYTDKTLTYSEYKQDSDTTALDAITELGLKR